AAFVRWKLIVPGDATTTAANILAHEPLFRLLLAADLTSAWSFVGATLLFHELLKPVNRNLSTLTATLSILSCPIVALAGLLQIAALVVLHGAQYFDAFPLQLVSHLTLKLFLDLQAEAHGISLVVFALCGLLVAYLVLSNRRGEAKCHA